MSQTYPKRYVYALVSGIISDMMLKVGYKLLFNPALLSFFLCLGLVGFVLGGNDSSAGEPAVAIGELLTDRVMADHAETAIDRQAISMVISMPVAFAAVGYDVGYFVGSSLGRWAVVLTGYVGVGAMLSYYGYRLTTLFAD